MFSSGRVCAISIFCVLFSSIPIQVQAANINWIGSGTHNWTDAGAWAGGVVPGVNDTANFSGAGICNLNVNAQVAHFVFAAGFNGVFNQLTFNLTITPGFAFASTRGMILNSGTFNGSNNTNVNITTSGIFTLGGATFTSTRGRLFVYRDFTSTGNFIHNNGWMVFAMNGTGDQNIKSVDPFFKVEFNSNGGVFNNRCDIDGSTGLLVLDTLMKTGNSQNRLFGGDIHVEGNIIINYNGVYGAGDASIIIDGTGDQLLVGRPFSFYDGYIENPVVNKTSGNLFIINTIMVANNWTYISGNIIPGISKVYFFGSGTIRVADALNNALYNVTFQCVGSGDTWYVNATDTLTVIHDLTIVGDNGTDIYNGFIHAKGDILVTNNPGNSFCGGNANIVINGDSDQLLQGHLSRKFGFLPTIIIDKPPGSTLYMKDTINVERNWEYRRGTVDAITFNSYVNFVYNPNPPMTSPSPAGGYVIDGEGPGGATMLFNKIEIQLSRKLQGDVHIKNQLIINNNILALNGNDLYLENAASSFIQRGANGYILSETSSPPSSIYWYIDNAGSGTSYTFPFVAITQTPTLIYPNIFFDLNIQTAGIPSGATGWVSVATYPTDPSLPANNRPLPPGITNLNNSIGLENAPRELDRFWVYDCGNYSTKPQVSMTFRYLDQEWNTGTNQITESRMRPHQWNGVSAWNNPNGGTIDTVNNVSTTSNVTTCSAFTLVDTTLFVQLIFHATDTSICKGETIQFIDDNLTPPLSRQWYFPGGVPPNSTAASPLVRYNNVGCYNAILWSTYPGGTGTIKDTLFCYIHVGDSFSISLTPTDILCYGDGNGTASVAVSRPGTYQYIWGDVPTSTPNRTGLAAGEYHVTVVDTSVIGCDRIDSFTIIEPDSLNLVIDNVIDATCTCDGNARANVSGGTAPFTYQWDSSGIAQTSNTLCPGLRSVTVTDASGCTISDTVTISSGSVPLIVTIDSVKHVTCNGQCNGTAHVIATGGAGGYSYSWSCLGLTTPTAVTLCGGPCTVTVEDSGGCSATASAVVNEPQPLVITVIGYDISTAGANDGRVRALATGGTLPYVFTHSPGCSPPCNIDTAIYPQDSLHNLNPGQICFTVSDKNFCFDLSCDTIIDPFPPLVLTMGKTDVTCSGICNGTAWVVVTGGSGSYTYSWSSGVNSTNDTVIGLCQGAVTVTVTDTGGGGTATGNVTINQPSGSPITYSLNIQIPSCNGSSDGKAWVTALSGGVSPYSYLWSRGTNTTNDTVSGLAAGDLYLIIEDSVGCKNFDTVFVSEPTVISISQTITPVTCPGGSNGAISVSVSGGIGFGYGQLWSIGAITSTISGIPEGFYSVIANDGVGCTATESYSVGVGTRFEISANVVNASCGNNDGIIDITVLSGTAIAYSWSNGRTTEDIDTLTAGQYSVIVTAGSCSQTLTVTVENSGRPIVSGSVANAISCSSNDGGISLSVMGGTTYTFAWLHGPSTSIVSSLAPGSYTVTVTDDTTLCQAVSTFDVGVLNGISLSATVTDATCNAKDGAIDLTVLSGSGTYTYTWSNGATTVDITTLGFGTYGVTVTDNTGCRGDSLFTVNEGGPAITGTVTNVSCFGKKDGAIAITVSGTNTYAWSTGAVSANISSLAPGTYSVTVNNTSQCSSAKVFTVTEPDAFALTADKSAISCFGADDGWIDLTVAGGNGGYTYSWTGPGFTDTQQDISSLAPGTYNVTTTDSKSCTTTLSSIQITEPSAMVLTIDTVRVSCGGLSDGQASVSVTGGVPDYTYLWSAGSPNDNDTVMNLPTGPISVIVTDANNCTATKSSVINQQPPLVVTINKTDISCFGLTNGQATVSANGGTPGYHYAWSKGNPQLPDSSLVLNLDSGYVSVTVSDFKNCTASDSVRIIEPALLSTTIVSDSVNCFGGSDGSAIVTPTGGTKPFAYTWSAGITQLTDSIVGGLLPGDVYVTVTDLRNCQVLDTSTIYQPTALVLVMDSTNNICPGTSNGTATVTVSGGTPNYIYTWSPPVGQPGATSNVRIQLPAGPVSVTVKDANNCSAVEGVNISEPPAIVLSLSQSNISCFGANDGRAYVTASGGNSSFAYSWSSGTPPLNLDSVLGLSAGNVTVTVTDSLGCRKDSFVNIIEPTEIALVMDSVNISCFGLTDGQASVTASGGTPGTGYTYSWNTSDVSPNISGQATGIKSVTVTDSRSCTNSDSVNIVEPPQLIITSISQTNVSCFGGADGTATVIATGGTPSQPGAAGYTYTWNPAGTPISPNDSVRNLSAGTVNVTVTDSRGCPADTNTTITQPADSISTVITKTDVSCFGGTDGTAKVIATGGTPGSGYTYSWNPAGTPVTPGDSVRNLPAGLVSVIVTDANGCTKPDNITLIQPADLVLTIVVDSNTNCYGGTTGGLTVSLIGGTPTYNYSWSTTPPQLLLNTTQTNHSIAGLGVGNYTVTVTDLNNCVKQSSEDIIERPGPQIDSITGVVLDRPTCDRADGSITLNVTTQDPGLTYVWNPSVGTGNTASGLAEGTYNVTVTDASDCDEPLSIELIDIPGPSVEFIKIKDSYCDDYDGRATAIITGGTPDYTFEWIDANSVVISNDSVVTGLDPGPYSVLIKDANDCPYTNTFTITNIASPNAQIFPVSPQVIYVGQVVNLTATSDIPNSLFIWKPTSGLSCGDCDTLTANPAETITYSLTVSDASTGCSDTAYMTIIVKDEKNVFVPNVITPNGDGVNDTWNISDLLEVFPDNEVAIINRWGDEVFRAKNYGSFNNNWDGLYKGEKLPDGTYYYIIKLNNIEKSVTGPVTIISE